MKIRSVLLIFLIIFQNNLSAQLLNDSYEEYQQKYKEVISTIQKNLPETKIIIESFLKKHASPLTAKEILVIAGENSFFRNDDNKSIFYWNELYQYDKIISNHAKYRLAQIHIRQKQYEKALLELESITQKSDSTDFHAGLCAYQLWKKNKEEIYFQKIIIFWKNNSSTPKKALLEIYQHQKNDFETEKLLIDLLNSKYSNDVLNIALENAFTQKKYEKVIFYFDKYLKNKNIELSDLQNYTIGTSFYHQKDYQQSLPFFLKIVTKENNFGQQAAYYLGKIKSIEANFFEANLYFWQASRFDFDTITQKNAENIVKKINQFYEKNTLKIDTNHQKNDYLEEEKKLLLEKNFSKAVELLEKKINDKSLKEEEKLAVKFWLAEGYFQQSQVTKAITLYQEILHWKSNNEKYLLASHYGLANAYLLTQKYEVAIMHFQFFIMMNKEENYLDAIVRLADSYLKINDLSNAKLFYQKTNIEKQYASVCIQNIEKYEREKTKDVIWHQLPINDEENTEKKLSIVQQKISQNELKEAQKMVYELSNKIGFFSEIMKGIWLQYWEKSKQLELVEIAHQYWKI